MLICRALPGLVLAYENDRRHISFENARCEMQHLYDSVAFVVLRRVPQVRSKSRDSPADTAVGRIGTTSA